MANREKKPQVMTITEAVDNLSSMAEIDAVALEAEMLKGDEAPFEKRQWLDVTDEERTYTSVKESFRTVHNYLKKVYKEEREYLYDVEAQKGIHAIMQLAGEAAESINSCKGLFKKAHSGEDFTQIKEFKDLKDFYLDKIVKKFQKAIESEEAWQQEWGGEFGEEDLADIERRGLKELEQVRKDAKYELFFIRTEDDRPFFNRNLVRHIRLVTDFDEMIIDKLGDDPLLKVRTVQDKEACFTAEAIRDKVKTALQNFCRHGFKAKESALISYATSATMALFLASNHRNLLAHTTGKSCLGYLEDFVYYLKEAFSSVEYAKLITSNEEELEPSLGSALALFHSLSYQLHLSASKRDDAIGLIFDIIKRGSEERPFHKMPATPLHMWSALLDYHDSVQNLLRRYPNGPLMKLITIFDEGVALSGFEPYSQDNFPSSLYTFKMKKKVTLLRLPSPTFQRNIGSAKVLAEFKAYLRQLGRKKVLMFNMQDRTSSSESARARALEKLQDDFPKNLTVVTLPKATDFYHQSEDYLELSDPKEFMAQLKSQIAGGEECGFYFPAAVKKTEVRKFTEKAVPFIYKAFFGKKKNLSRKNRLDFIEIFYQFLTLKIMELTSPDYTSFTCKDAIDVGGTQSMAFYGFLKVLGSADEWSEDERNFLLYMAFAPALTVRSRGVDIHRLSRMVSALSVLSAESDVHRSKMTKEAEGLFDTVSFSETEVEEV